MCDRDHQDLQETINKLLDWACTWGMSFKKSKCKVMLVGTSNPKYDMQDTKLAKIKEEKGVSVTIHNSMKPARQCQKAATNGLGVLHKLRKNFHFRDRHVFVKLNKQYVRPHLEFATRVWSPWLSTDKQVVKNVQKKFVNTVAGLHPGSYDEKCQQLGLETLEERRHLQDLVQT
jgi:hypothetical protein